MPYVNAYQLNEKTVYLLANGSMFNLTAGYGDSLNAFDVTLAVMAAGIGHIVGAGRGKRRVVPAAAVGLAAGAVTFLRGRSSQSARGLRRFRPTEFVTNPPYNPSAKRRTLTYNSLSSSPHFRVMPVKIRVLVLTLLALQAGAGFAPRALASDNAAALHATQPELASGSAMVVDMQTHKVMYARNPDEVVPIASITKLMTAMVTLDAHLPLDEMLAVDIHQTPEMKGVYSRVRLNSEISRKDMLLLALMSSENRAAASLAHHYRGLQRLHQSDERQGQGAGHDQYPLCGTDRALYP